MSPYRTEILATLLEIMCDVFPPRTKILATPLIYTIHETLEWSHYLDTFKIIYLQLCPLAQKYESK